jgi:hypothetical protein
VTRTTLGRLDALRPPTTLAASYGALVGILREQFDARDRLRTTLAAHRLPSASDAYAADTHDARRFNRTSYEMGLPVCAASLPRTHFTGRTPKERIAARVDELCAPATGAHGDARTVVDAMPDEVRQHKLTQAQANRLVADKFDDEANRIDAAATHMSALHISRGAQGALTHLADALHKVSADTSAFSSAIRVGHTAPAAIQALQRDEPAVVRWREVVVRVHARSSDRPPVLADRPMSGQVWLTGRPHQLPLDDQTRSGGSHTTVVRPTASTVRS